MAKIDIIARNFTSTFSHINGITQEDVSKLDIIRAIVTLGAAGRLDMIRYGWRGLSIKLCDAIRTLLITESRRGELVLSDTFELLVQTEKATTSYWLAMALAKLTVEKKLGVPWLSHVDRLLKQGVLSITQGTAERGDLAGKDANNGWHVLEVKGRSHSVESNLIGAAKSQASRVTNINGKSPRTASACIVRLFNTPISVELIDPKSDYSNPKTSWKLTDPEFYPVYYESFIDHLKEAPTKTLELFGLDFDIAIADSLGSGLWVGLSKKIRENPNIAPEVAAFLYENNIRSEENTEMSLGYDGILFTSNLIY